MEILEQRDEMETSSSLLNYSASNCVTEVIKTESSSLNILLEDGEKTGREMVSVVQVGGGARSSAGREVVSVVQVGGGARSSAGREVVSVVQVGGGARSSADRALPGGSSHPRHLLIPCESRILHLSSDRPIFLRRNLRVRSSPMVDIAEKIKKIIIEAGPEVLIPGSIGIITTGKGITRHHLETILEEPMRQNGELTQFSSWKKYQRRRGRFRAQIQRRLITEANVKDISKQFLNMGL